MNVEEAWDRFSTSSIQKTSVKGMLDTMAAQINEIQQSTARTAELVPKILGDDAATQAAMEQGPPMGGMPGMGGMGMPGMGAPDMAGGEEPMATDEEMPEGDMPMEGMPEEGMPEEGVPEEGVPEEDMPMEDELGEEGLGEDEGMLEDEGMPEDGGLPPEDDESMFEDDGMIPEDDEAMFGDEMGGMEAPVEEDMGTGRKSLDEIAIELIREGKREEAQTILDAAARLNGTSMDEGLDMGGDMPMDEGIPMEEGLDDEDIFKSAIKKDGDMTEDMGSPLGGTEHIEASDDGADAEGEDPIAMIDGLIAELEALKESYMEGDGDIEEVDETPADVEIEIEAEEEPEEGSDEEASDDESPNDKKNEELVGEDSEHVENCNGGQQVPTDTLSKSAHTVSFRELMEAKMRGDDALAPFMKSSESTDFAEFDPWGKSKYNMFRKNTQTIADELNDVSRNTTGNAPEGGDMLDDVDEEKGMSEGGTGSGDKLDEVTTENPSGEGGQGGDLLDDISKDDGAKNPQPKTEDLLDTVDQKQPTGTSGEGGDMLDDVKKSAQDNGIHMRTLKEMMDIKKSGTRPDAVSSVGGEMDRPSLDKITKSTMPEPVRMGWGVDPKKVIERDLAEYNLYKARKTF